MGMISATGAESLSLGYQPVTKIPAILYLSIRATTGRDARKPDACRRPGRAAIAPLDRPVLPLSPR
jgi:hypothetical protein